MWHTFPCSFSAVATQQITVESVGRRVQSGGFTRHIRADEAFLQVAHIFVSQRARQLEVDSSNQNYVGGL